jgi:hypothetical protein
MRERQYQPAVRHRRKDGVPLQRGSRDFDEWGSEHHGCKHGLHQQSATHNFHERREVGCAAAKSAVRRRLSQAQPSQTGVGRPCVLTETRCTFDERTPPPSIVVAVDVAVGGMSKGCAFVTGQTH